MLGQVSGPMIVSPNGLVPNWDHFSQPVISGGKVLVFSHDAHIYGFGLN